MLNDDMTVFGIGPKPPSDIEEVIIYTILMFFVFYIFTLLH